MDPEAIHQARIKRSIDDLRTRRDQLIAEIQNVFKDVELGDGITLCEAEVVDNYGTQEERARAREIDQDIHWSQVDLEEIDPGCTALHFVDPAGFRFYLPAYMEYTLKHGFSDIFGGVSTDSLNHEFAIYQLNASMYKSSEECEAVKANYANFSRCERVCIARFLALYAELETSEIFDEAFEALRNHWGQYLSIQEMRNLQKIWPNRLS